MVGTSLAPAVCLEEEGLHLHPPVWPGLQPSHAGERSITKSEQHVQLCPLPAQTQQGREPVKMAFPNPLPKLMVKSRCFCLFPALPFICPCGELGTGG